MMKAAPIGVNWLTQQAPSSGAHARSTSHERKTEEKKDTSGDTLLLWLIDSAQHTRGQVSNTLQNSSLLCWRCI